MALAVDPARAARWLPPGLEIDSWRERAVVGVVGLTSTGLTLGERFVPTGRVDQVNLRLYVRRPEPDARRGVLFLRQVVGRRGAALVARWLYGQPAETREVVARLGAAGVMPRPGRWTSYAWRDPEGWRVVGACAGEPLADVEPGSEAAFLWQRTWGYAARGDGTLEFRLERPVWRVWTTTDHHVDAGLDVPGAEPLSAWLAEGSRVRVHPPRAIA